MTVRERIEQRERETLSPYAALSVETRGRERPIDPCPVRTDYQRDRDRIIHCKAFRRLKGKTQVFMAPQGDHYRTRLTHTLEVSQVARSIARGLSLNEDLAEAIALGHDLGHTPFGHIGEKALNECMRGGFSHNEQSRRVVEVLEENGEGLNLTWEVRDGIAHHSGKVRPATLEGCCVHLADRIAYINHDIDDAIRAGVLREQELPARCIRELGKSSGARINTMILAVIEHSEGREDVTMRPDVWETTMLLRDFLFERVYSRDWAAGEERKAEQLVHSLWTYFLAHPAQMPLEYVEICYREGTERGVCDYIACMTDRYAIETYQKLFIPESFEKI